MPLREGTRLEVVCTALDEDGAGLARSPDFPAVRLHVAGALPHERVHAIVEHVSPHRSGVAADAQAPWEAWARTETIETPAEDRVPPVCPAYGACGGCPLQHLDYAAQVRWKRERVVAALAKHPALAKISVAPCVASPRPFGYRNQAKYVYGRATDGRQALGAYAPRSHAIVDMAGCQVVEPVLDQVAALVRERLSAHEVPPWQEADRTGFLRYVVIRANTTPQVLVTLVTGAAPWPRASQVAREIRDRDPRVVGVVQNLNPSAGNVLFGPEDRLLDGRDTIEDTVGGVPVALAPRSFFQINRWVAALAYQEIQRAVRALGPITRAVDAYAGAGGIAFHLAPLASEVVAIEHRPTATTTASDFAARRSPHLGVRFVMGDVGVHLGRVGPADVVVLNPPRRGCTPEVLSAAAALGPRLIAYLSCDPETLARDLVTLALGGYVVDALVPYDMLPHTPHVEALALLGKRPSPAV